MPPAPARGMAEDARGHARLEHGVVFAGHGGTETAQGTVADATMSRQAGLVPLRCAARGGLEEWVVWN